MIDTNAPFEFESGRRSFAHWAAPRPRRRMRLSALLGPAVMRLRPRAAILAGLSICAASATGMVLVVASF